VDRVWLAATTGPSAFSSFARWAESALTEREVLAGLFEDPPPELARMIAAMAIATKPRAAAAMIAIRRDRPGGRAPR
jgi:hypothetical protein